QKGAWVTLIYVAPQLFKKSMRFRKIFTIRSVPLKKIRHRTKPEPVDSHLTPVIHHLKYFFLNCRIIVVQIWLMEEKAMPVILLCDWIPGPVGSFKILEDNSGV